MDLPQPRTCRTPEDFEDAAADWLEFFGFQNVVRTPKGPDGGVDVRATGVVAQVKAHQTPIGRPDVQGLRGAAHRGEIAIFFSLNGYTAHSKQYADDADVALFEFTGYDGSAEPTNAHADSLLLRVPQFRAARDAMVRDRVEREAAHAREQAAREAADARERAEQEAAGRAELAVAQKRNRIGAAIGAVVLIGALGVAAALQGPRPKSWQPMQEGDAQVMMRECVLAGPMEAPGAFVLVAGTVENLGVRPLRARMTASVGSKGLLGEHEVLRDLGSLPPKTFVDFSVPVPVGADNLAGVDKIECSSAFEVFAKP